MHGDYTGSGKLDKIGSLVNVLLPGAPKLCWVCCRPTDLAFPDHFQIAL